MLFLSNIQIKSSVKIQKNQINFSQCHQKLCFKIKHNQITINQKIKCQMKENPFLLLHQGIKLRLANNHLRTHFQRNIKMYSIIIVEQFQQISQLSQQLNQAKQEIIAKNKQILALTDEKLKASEVFNEKIEMMFQLNEHLKQRLEEKQQIQDIPSNRLKQQTNRNTAQDKSKGSGNCGATISPESNLQNEIKHQLEDELKKEKEKNTQLVQVKYQLMEMLENAQNYILKCTEQNKQIDLSSIQDLKFQCEAQSPQISSQSLPISKLNEKIKPLKTQYINKVSSHLSHKNESPKLDSNKLIKEIDIQNTLINDFFEFFKVDNLESFGKKLAKIQHQSEVQSYRLEESEKQIYYFKAQLQESLKQQQS